MIGPELLGLAGMVMEGSTTHVGWGLSSMLVGSGVGVGIRTGFIGLMEGEGHHFGVAPNVEQTLLVVEEEANLAANMTVFFLHRRHERI